MNKIFWFDGVTEQVIEISNLDLSIGLFMHLVKSGHPTSIRFGK